MVESKTGQQSSLINYNNSSSTINKTPGVASSQPGQLNIFQLVANRQIGPNSISLNANASATAPTAPKSNGCQLNLEKLQSLIRNKENRC